jgi:hypothetical protein
LPENQRSEATQKSVQMTMNVVGILAAIVLGLFIASTKANFDTRSKEVEQFSASLTLLDRELVHLGQEDLRGLLRSFTTRKIATMWRATNNAVSVRDEADTAQMLEDIEDQLRALTPEADAQREGRRSALQLAGELKRTNRLLVVQQNSRTPRPFLIVILFWLSALFLSYALFAPRNAVVIATMLVSAFSVSIAMNLTFDMDQPFAGFIRVSPVPMQQALDQMQR